MHIPDGFIDGKVAAVSAALSTLGVGLALRRVRAEMPPRKVPLLGLSAAFLFAAQMLNFPVWGGTSGHLIGGVLAAALLGPGAAVVVVTTVLIVQCFLFQDGGVLALGANVFNMAIVGAGGGGILYRLLCRRLPGDRGRITAIAFAGWASTVAASITCAGQLAWSGTVPWSAGFTAMAGIHMLIGLGEGLISALVFLAIQRTRPEMIVDTGAQPQRGLIRLGLLVAVGLALFVAPFACPWPDGFDTVVSKLGSEPHARAPEWAAPAPGYQAPGISWAAGATAIAGAIGAVVVFLLAWLLGRVLAAKSSKVHP